MMKYIVLFCALLVQLCIGGVYAWSVFVPKLKSELGFSNVQTQVIFSLTIFSFTLSMTFAGRMLSHSTPRRIASIGALLFLAGYLVASFSNGNFWLLLLGIGIIAGAGIGFCYICPMATTVRWFPEKKGLVTGMVVAGFGGGAILLVYLSEFLFHHGTPVLKAFAIIGIFYSVIMLLAAKYLLHSSENQTIQEKKFETDFNLSYLVKDKSFFLLFLGMFAGTFCGLMIIGNLKPVLALKGIEESIADLSVGLFAVGNSLGRILWGYGHDRVKSLCIPLSLLFLAIATLILIFSGAFSLLVLIASLAVGLGFGSCFVLYASQTIEYYGIENFGKIYPIIFLFGYGIGGSAGPIVGSFLSRNSNSYVLPGLIAVFFLGVASLYIFFGMKKSKM